MSMAVRVFETPSPAWLKHESACVGKDTELVDYEQQGMRLLPQAKRATALTGQKVQKNRNVCILYERQLAQLGSNTAKLFCDSSAENGCEILVSMAKTKTAADFASSLPSSGRVLVLQQNQHHLVVMRPTGAVAAILRTGETLTVNGVTIEMRHLEPCLDHKTKETLELVKVVRAAADERTTNHSSDCSTRSTSSDDAERLSATSSD